MSNKEEIFENQCMECCQPQLSSVAVFLPLSFKDSDILCKIVGSNRCSAEVIFSEFEGKISEVDMIIAKNYYFLVIFWDGKASIKYLVDYFRQQRKKYFIFHISSINY